MNLKRARIIVNGLVQGVGFRYYVLSKAQALGLNGYTQNLFTGEVLIVAEGDSSLINELIMLIKIGPSNAHVKNCTVEWEDYKNEFNSFEVKY